MYRIVIRGTTHQRQRPETSQRFGGESLIVPLSKRDMTADNSDFQEENWLGKTWMKEFNNSKMASLNQISAGLIAEAMYQLKLAMGKIKDQKRALAAQANIKKTQGFPKP